MTTTAEIRQLPAEGKCFRLRRYYLVVGVLCAVFFSVMGIISTLILGLFWSGFTLLAVWVILAYFRERLLLAGKTIIQLGIIRSKAIDSEQVIHVNWRCWPVGGSIVARTHSEKVTIYLHNFTTEEREEIICFFRETFANEIQDNWPCFEDFTRRFSSPQKRASRSEILVTALVFVCFAGVFVYVWFAGLGSHYLFIGAINAAAAFWCLWDLCTYKKPTESRMRKDPG